MPITFDGYTLTGGVTPLFGSTASSHGEANGIKCTLQRQSGVGASFDPFSVTFEGKGCDDCIPQAGDWIEVSATTILAVDVTTYRWSLCGGTCKGEKTQLGFSLGLEIKFLKWIV
jgi:hypothetical protein